MKLSKTQAKWKRLTLALIFTGALAACAGEEDSIQVAPVPQVSSSLATKELWRARVGDGVGHYYSRLSPVYAYNKVFTASRDGVVAAFSPVKGDSLWQKDLGKDAPLYISGGLTASYEKIFFGTEAGDLIALNEETGEILWRVNAGGEILAKPLADENLVIVHTSRGDLIAFDQQLGQERWKITTDVPNLTLRGDSAPASTSGGVFWGMANGRLGAAFINNGNVIWQQPVATPKGSSEIDRLVDVDAKPVIVGSTLYTLGYNGLLIAIDLRSGQPMWRRSYSGTNDFVVSGDVIYFSNFEDVLYAVDTRSGTELWNNAELKNRQLSAPAVIGGMLAVGDGEGYLHWLNISTGEFIAQQDLKGGGIAVPPIAVENNFLVITRDGKISMQSFDNAFGEPSPDSQSFQSDYQFDLQSIESE